MSVEELLARSAQVILALMGAYLVVLWFVSIVWTYRDIESRSRNVVTQVFATLLAILFPFLGLPLYLILRPKDTLDGAFQRSLEEEYLLQDLEELPVCPSCQHFVADDFLLCPHCHTKLRDACTSCERLVDLRWALCPYCGNEQGAESTIERVEAPAARWARPLSQPKPEPAVGTGRVAAPSRTERAAIVAGSSERSLTVVGGRSRANGTAQAQPDSAASSVELFVPRRGRFQRPTTSPEPSSNGRASHEQPRESVALHADGD